MNLTIALNLKDKEMISAIGGGGKTTILFALAKELFKAGKKVFLSTTTKIFLPEEEETKVIIASEDEILKRLKKEGFKSILVAGREVVEGNKIAGFTKEFYNYLFEIKVFDYILIEADGSKRKPIKFHASYEPVIPELSTKVLGVIGLDSLGKRLDNQIFHRAEEFCREFGYEIEDNIDERMVTRLIIDEKGLFKTSPLNSKKILILNKADDREKQKWAFRIINEIDKSCWKENLEKVIITSFEKNILVIA